MVNCTICNGNDFTIESGYYYCSVCGTQTQAIQEIEHSQGDITQNTGLDIRNSARKTRILGKTKLENDDAELTSWEEANYILLGMVNQLLELGVCEEFKLVTFQIWATYLEKINAAFFTQNGPALPKLPANYRFKDAKIVYNHTRKASVRNPRKTSGDKELSHKAKKFRKGRRQKAFINAEYNAFTSENEDTNTDTLSASAGYMSDKSNVSLPLEFTPNSRRLLKRKYSNKKHLNAHANDFNKKLKCHGERTKVPLKLLQEKPTRLVLLNILYIALNYVGSEIQLGDFLRYAREGHISMYEFEHFFPENLSEYVNSPNFVGTSFRSAYFPTHIIFRNKTRILTELLNYTDIKQPNILDLCKRYVTELCLPKDIIEIIEKLLSMVPPINMKFDQYYECLKVIPNYEGRAMGLIIFTLKLIFGLDDDRERSISKSARHINERIKLLNTTEYSYRNLFIFTDWLKYISKRNTTLQQCHYPTAIYFNEHPNTSTELYLNYLKQIIPNHFKNINDNEITRTKTRHYLKHQFDTMKNVQNIFDEIENLHAIHDNDKDNLQTIPQKCPINFPTSLTPSRSYFDKILSDDNLCRKFHIKKSTNICTFDEHDLLTYLHPKRLRLFFDKHDIDVNVRKNPLKLENLEFCRCFALDDPLRSMYSHFADDYIKCTTDIKHKTWLKNIRKENQERMDKNNLELYQNHVKIKKKVEKKLEDQTETNRKLKELNKKLLIKIEKDRGVKCEIISSSSDDEDNDDDDEKVDPKKSQTKNSNREQITFDITNYDNWIYTGYFNAHALKVFNRVLDTLPKSYQWLLKQCAFTIECTEKDLYFEALCVENQFAYGIHRDTVKRPVRNLSNESYLKTCQKIFYKCW